MKNEMTKSASYECPEMQMIFFKTEGVLAPSGTINPIPGNFFGEEDTFGINPVIIDY